MSCPAPRATFEPYRKRGSKMQLDSDSARTRSLWTRTRPGLEVFWTRTWLGLGPFWTRTRLGLEMYGLDSSPAILV
ncbi:hypothetical protein HOLleu_29579 [Holothuria leucospilota]|uniref:Uncharacterized protein n=1 Tax=Holothuria leucospilota TaxID=206669 RepID=A0A9Q1H1G1_HOLLE|nr:hypothetical protein HOLleu_29579 [Holothuria leucospilota]